MKIVNLLEFLNNTKELQALNYMTCDSKLVNFLDIITEDEQFTQKIDLGIIYLSQMMIDRYTIIDGVNRLLSLSLLLHAVCECYKKTTAKNDKAIKTIRTKYLLDDEKTKLRLPDEMQIIYDKIIFGERLSGKEKESSMFKLLHNFWTQIKEESLQASSIFKMLQKITVFIVEADAVSVRDLYYSLNNNRRNLDQFLLIADYMKSMGLAKEWKVLARFYKENSINMIEFFENYFITKFNFKEFNPNRLYEIYVNYFETMLQFNTDDVLIEKLKKVSLLYKDLLNVNLPSESLKKALIQIKMHNGEDTFAYLLNIYEDYADNNITEATFLEILLTIDEYLKNRLKTPNNVTFNELIEYLNAFITCK